MDQCFSCISRHLARNKACTLPELADAAVKAFTSHRTKPEVVYLEDTADVKAWLDPFKDEKVTHITGSH